jgi:hypothetical protein
MNDADEQTKYLKIIVSLTGVLLSSVNSILGAELKTQGK